MGLEQLLTIPDKALWKAHEYVTQKADYYLGWNKWDLARGCYNGAMTSALGYSIYRGILYSYSQNTTDFGLSVGVGAAAFGCHVVKKGCYFSEKYEQELFSRGIVESHHLHILRPVGYLIGAVNLSLWYLWYDINNDPSSLSQSLSSFLIGVMICSFTSALYFRDQIPKPPSQSKGKVQEWFGKLGELVGKKEAAGVK